MNEPEYPIQHFRFVALGVGDEVLGKMEADVEGFASKCWLIEAPSLMMDEEDASMVEVSLAVYSAHGVELPKHLDQTHLDEVLFLLSWLGLLSSAHELTVECYLDDTFVGCINQGQSDDLLTEGLIGEWQRHLESM